MPAPTLEQVASRGRDDDVALTSTTFNGGGGLNGDWTQLVDVNFRVRFAWEETANNNATNKQYRLQYNNTGAGWVNISTVSADIKIPTTAEYANEDAAGQIITAGGTLEEGIGVESPGSFTNQFTLKSEITESEWVLIINSGSVLDADTIDLRVVESDGTPLDIYQTDTSPTITVDNPTPVLEQTASRGRNDDVVLDSATFNGGGGLNGDWSQVTSSLFRIRFAVAETNDVSSARTYALESNKNSGGWQDITTSSTNIKSEPSSQYSDGDPTQTQRIGSGTFTDGEGVEQSGSTNSITTQNNETEIEFLLRLDPRDITNLDTIEVRVKGLNTYQAGTTPTVTVTKTTAVLDQDAIQGRDDDVVLNSATFNGGGGLNGNWTQAVDTPFRLRLVLQETAGGDAFDFRYRLQYNTNSAGWLTITAASADVRIDESAQYQSRDVTTQVIGSGSFVVGSGIDLTDTQSSFTDQINNETEHEFCLEIIGASTSGGDTIQIRAQSTVTGVGVYTDLDAYTNTPTITVAGAAPARRVMVVS